MNIEPVHSGKQRKEFIQVAKVLYRDDPVWVCPLDADINAIFDPAKNVYHKHGIAERWILKDGHHRLIGRIAAFIDYKTSHTHEQPTGGIGFFECIDDLPASALLFDTAREWLAGQGMDAMDGPINFGERDSYWGLLVEGFTHPSYEVAYNPPYYRRLFEQYGFRLYFRQEGFHLDMTRPIPERFMKIADWVARKPGYQFEHFTWKNMHRCVEDFAKAFNQAWGSFREDFEPLQTDYIIKTLKKGRAIIEEEFIWIAYHNDEPIAIYLMYPDVNMILKHLNGKMHVLNMIRFLCLKKRKAMTRARGVLMGVVPKYQGLGIESAVMKHVAAKMEMKKHYTEVEFSWVGDFNPKMRRIFLATGAVPVKHYITYRYLFDRTKPFKRYPISEE